MNWDAVGHITYIVLCYGSAVVSLSMAFRSYLRVRRPRPSSRNEISELRELSLKKARERSLFEFYQDLDEVAIGQQKYVENLRFYDRYIDQLPASHLDVIVSGLRYCRVRGITKLKSADFTDEHMAVYQQFEETLKSSESHDEVTKSAFYAISRPSDAEMIATIVVERGVHDFKIMKTMLAEMKSNEVTGSSILTEGML